MPCCSCSAAAGQNLLINIIIGIVQEIKAKKTIDKLSIVTAPTATVIRDALTREVPVKELVLDEIPPIDLFKNPEFIAEIEWIKEKDGGRKTIPYGNRYMPQIVIHKKNNEEDIICTNSCVCSIGN